MGLEAIKAKVTKPLEGLKVVNYYGCLLTRPPQITGHPNHEYPMDLDVVCDALGAESLDWDDKTICCGGSLAVPAKEVMLKLSQDIVEHAQAVGRRCHHRRVPAVPLKPGRPADADEEPASGRRRSSM